MKLGLRALLLRREARFLIGLFLLITIWRIFLMFDTSAVETNLYHLKVWGALYQIVALVGAVSGLFVSKPWGWHRSVMGRSIMAFSLGLFLQVFGQSVYSYYNLLLHQEVLYPSIGDIGFFGSIPLYIYGVLLLAKASGVVISLRSFTNKIQAIIIPLIMLTVSYLFFLKGYEFDWTQPLTTFLDFGYPLGQAVYVSLAILTYTLSRKFLGGDMRIPTLFLVIALVVQYVCDYSFLYISSRGVWVVGGIFDYLYLVSYLIMSLSLLRVGTALAAIRSSRL